MLIREATGADWPDIWAFFAPIVAAGETYVYDRQLPEALARDRWMQGRTTVAVDAAGRVVGSAKAGPNHEGQGAHIATASFMVDPTASGAGVGRALGQEAIDWAAGHGFRAMVFNAVVESNTRAVQLWRSLGFEVLATIPQAFASPTHGLVGLHVMHRRL